MLNCFAVFYKKPALKTDKYYSKIYHYEFVLSQNWNQSQIVSLYSFGIQEMKVYSAFIVSTVQLVALISLLQLISVQI